MKPHNERLAKPNGRCPKISDRPQKQSYDFTLGGIIFLQIHVENFLSFNRINSCNLTEHRKCNFPIHRMLFNIDQEIRIHFFHNKLLRFHACLSSGPVIVPVNIVHHGILLLSG